ncbi:MAG TPA: hypothetical protein VG755_18290 [Nannocystaceae bacterium]|nr:hypothetical protein [Nannocystaceae bacterium]
MTSRLRLAIPFALLLCAGPAAARADVEMALEPGAPTDVDLNEVADDDALELDVLALTSLPLAADEARRAGIDAAEVADVIGAVMDVGASPAVATELLLAETQQAKKRGEQPHFAGWVRGQLAEGVHSKALVEKIEKAEAEYIELSAAERRRLDAKLATMRGEMRERRHAQEVKLGELVKKGKRLRVAGEARFAELRERMTATMAERSKALAEVER